MCLSAQRIEDVGSLRKFFKDQTSPPQKTGLLLKKVMRTLVQAECLRKWSVFLSSFYLLNLGINPTSF